MNSATSLSLGATLISTLALTSAAGAQLVISPADNYIIGSQPSGMAAADIDGDGDMDLISTVDGPDRVATLLNDGTGLYSPGPVAFLGASASPQDVRAGDFDGDGDMDLAVAVRDPAGAVVILLNNGAGSFTVSSSVPAGDRPRGLDIADHDNDGDLDIAVANRDGGTATIMTNSGAGTFTAQTVAAGNEPRATAFIDLDGDGDRDLAVTVHDDSTLVTYANNAGTFAQSMVIPIGGIVRPEGIDAADLDGDGDEDLVVALSDVAFSQVGVFINTGGGLSGPVGYATGGQNSSQVVAADFDCDGAMDVAVSNSDSNNVSFLLNIGAGVFGPAMLTGTGLNPGEITAADLDGDGDADVATAAGDSTVISVLINDTCTPVEPCETDLNGDGATGPDDLAAVLDNWGRNPGHPADFNGDGVVGPADLAKILEFWGPCN